jgi:streptogramin lyase
MTGTQSRTLAKLAGILVTSVAAITVASLSAQAADVVLSGTISSGSGQKIVGATVSAKQDGSSITTSVYTDEQGNYYFPPMPAGKYQVWAQTLSFEMTKNAVDLAAARRTDLVLKPITDAERRIRQMPGEMLMAALPEETPGDANTKRTFRNLCTGCHTPSYVLQFRFDEDGWSKIIDLMKVVPNNGVYPANPKANALIDFHQKELAAYLARARGPGESSMKVKTRPPLTGEAARAVWKLYDLPTNQDAGIGTKYQTNDGTDWSLGTTSKIALITHDGGMDLDGNLWFTTNAPNRLSTVGRVDGKTGEVKFLKVPRNDGLAATAHGLARDEQGNFWFDVNPGRRSLGKLDPKTEKITVYQTPQNMSPLGGAVTVDVDGKGMVWASAPDGAVRFDPQAERFSDFKSTAYKTARGTGMTYGAAGDRDGNGWWTQMAFDIVGKADVATGKTIEVQLPVVKSEFDRVSPEVKAFYDKYDGLSFGTPLPWQQGPRRMGTDKNADVLWVGNSWGGSLTRIDTRTLETTIVPLPDPSAMQPYHLAVDKNHGVWGNMWTNDQITRYDPATANWTVFDLPVRGTEIRHIALNDKDGVTQVIVPVYRTNQMGVMTVRSEAELAALKAQAQR